MKGEQCENCHCCVDGQCRVLYPEYVGCPYIDYNSLLAKKEIEKIAAELDGMKEKHLFPELHKT